LFLPASPGALSTYRRSGNLSRVEQVFSFIQCGVSSRISVVAQLVRCGVTTIFFRIVSRLPGTAPCTPDVVCQPRLRKDTAGDSSLRYSWRLTATIGAVRCDADWCLSFLGLVDLRRSLGGGFCYTREKPPNYQLSFGSMNDESWTQDLKSNSRNMPYLPCPRSSRQRAGTNLINRHWIVRGVARRSLE
jgi:hypothetical protein